MISDTRLISSFLKRKKNREIALDMEMSQIGLNSEQTFFREIFFFLTFRSSKRGSTEHRGDGIFRRDELLETTPSATRAAAASHGTTVARSKLTKILA